MNTPDDPDKKAAMNATESTIPPADLHAYADGQLAPARRAEIAGYLAENPDAAAKVAEWQRQNEALGALFDPVAAEPVPERLSPHRLAQTMSRDRWARWQRIAAAGLFAILGAGAGWTARTAALPAPDSPPVLMSAAIDAHELFTSQPVHPVEVTARQSGHLTSWLSNTIDRHLVMPDLQKLGFTLVGGRILPTKTGSAAQIMYQDQTGQRITLYITPRAADQKLARSFETVNGVSALYWANASITCTVVGQLSRPEMEAVAGAVFQALSPGNPAYRIS